MSRVDVKEALTAAVAADTRLRAVGPDVSLVAQKLPAAGIVFGGDEQLVTAHGPGSQAFIFKVRLYVALGRDLEAAEDELLALADRLDEHLAIFRRLTDTAFIVGRTNGAPEIMQGDNGPDLLVYETTVRVEQRAVYDATLTDGTSSVVLRDVETETYPTQPPTLTIEPDASGALIPYLSHINPETLSVSGRIESAAEAGILAGWVEAGTSLSYSDTRGTERSGWRVLGTSGPRIERRSGAVDVFAVELTLWRL